MTKEVQVLLKQRDAAFRSGDGVQYSAARSELKRGIREAKAAYKRRIEDHFSTNNSRQVWQGVQHLTNYKPCNTTLTEGNAELAEELNHFFARFEVKGPEAAAAKTSDSSSSPSLIVQEYEVRRTLRAVNPRKAAGPDGVTAKVLKECADQLAGVFTKIFNTSLSQSCIPPCLKSATIVPLPKRTNISSLNDYRPVALTPVIMKCFEKLVRRHIMSCLPPTLDSLQFAYRANRSTEDAIATTLHTTISHLEVQGRYARLLFVDFSSAFNTILPDRLIVKLLEIGLPSTTCRWIRDFLSDRVQRVRVGPHLSSALSLNTGSPQGCVLSPLLYTLYTHDCVSTHPDNAVIKFADDTTVVGLISGGDETAYRAEVQRLSEWCVDNNLDLNTTKTKELVVDFRRRKSELQPVSINGECVERVSSFKFLGVHIDTDLQWSSNTSAVLKKAQQRLHFLRILRKMDLKKELLTVFYRCSIESVLTYCIGVWFSSCTTAHRKALQRVINMAQKITGHPLPSLKDLYSTRCLKRARSILRDCTHPGHRVFKLLPSGRRFRLLRSRTNRLKDSFYNRAIALINANS
uniref:Reverse transcriptase domain-containing protein n=1 Tax=Oreochromis niloticus TaxID=8128 RepID=A0A669E0D3_ORENI